MEEISRRRQYDILLNSVARFFPDQAIRDSYFIAVTCNNKAMYICHRIYSKIFAFTQSKEICEIKFANEFLPKSLCHMIVARVFTRMMKTHQMLPGQIHLFM